MANDDDDSYRLSNVSDDDKLFDNFIQCVIADNKNNNDATERRKRKNRRTAAASKERAKAYKTSLQSELECLDIEYQWMLRHIQELKCERIVLREQATAMRTLVESIQMKWRVLL